MSLDPSVVSDGAYSWRVQSEPKDYVIRHSASGSSRLSSSTFAQSKNSHCMFYIWQFWPTLIIYEKRFLNQSSVMCGNVCESTLIIEIWDLMLVLALRLSQTSLTHALEWFIFILNTDAHTHTHWHAPSDTHTHTHTAVAVVSRRYGRWSVVTRTGLSFSITLQLCFYCLTNKKNSQCWCINAVTFTRSEWKWSRLHDLLLVGVGTLGLYVPVKKS